MLNLLECHSNEFIQVVHEVSSQYGLPDQGLFWKLVSMVNSTLIERQKIVSISHCESYHTKTYHS